MEEFVARNLSDMTFDNETRFERCNVRHCTFNVTCHFDRCNIIECTNTENCDCVKSNIIEHEDIDEPFHVNPEDVEVESTEIVDDADKDS